MDDAALVDAARSGDGTAWGAIYDRYADKLHDHCHRILRDRDEAADALHDAFLAAAAHLDQLRDPSRLRPWLYSICRHEALKRAKHRARVDLVDEVDEMSTFDVDMDRGSRATELQELVWSAAAGLSERDRALLDLNLRQGLEGQDLADAMGTSLSNSYVMLSRLRDQVERSLGALLIARLGRDDCEELAAILVGWDGAFSPLLRKRVARHVDGCEVCTERKAGALSPMALLAAAPLVPAPSSLRRRVLDDLAAGGPAEPISFTRAGFAGPSAGPRRRLWPAWLVAAVALLVLALGAVALAVQDDDPSTVAAVGGAATSTTASSTTTTEAVTSTTTSTTSTTSTTVPEVAPPVVDPETPPPVEPPVVVPPPDTTAPTIGAVRESNGEIHPTGSSTCTPNFSRISALIVGATTVTLRWDSPPLVGSTAMTTPGSIWSAEIGGFSTLPPDLTLEYTIVAVDAAGNQATRSGSLFVTPCPQ